MSSRNGVAILGVIADSGTGKTTLLVQLVPQLRDRGIRVCVVKKAHPSFEVDTPGKDSYVLRKSGARKVLVVSDRRWAMMADVESDKAPGWREILREINQSDLDLILVEGFRQESFDKIEVHRSETGKHLRYPDDPTIIAVATDDKSLAGAGLPLLPLDSPEQVADFVVAYVR